METAIVKITGMIGASCVNKVRSALGAINGVNEVTVSLDRGEAVVRYDPRKARAEQLRTAVRVMGFEVSSITLAGAA